MNHTLQHNVLVILVVVVAVATTATFMIVTSVSMITLVIASICRATDTATWYSNGQQTKYICEALGNRR